MSGFPKQSAAAAAFVNGHMFLGTFGEDVILRLDENARGELLKKRGTG